MTELNRIIGYKKQKFSDDVEFDWPIRVASLDYFLVQPYAVCATVRNKSDDKFCCDLCKTEIEKPVYPKVILAYGLTCGFKDGKEMMAVYCSIDCVAKGLTLFKEGVLTRLEVKEK